MSLFNKEDDEGDVGARQNHDHTPPHMQEDRSKPFDEDHRCFPPLEKLGQPPPEAGYGRVTPSPGVIQGPPKIKVADERFWLVWNSFGENPIVRHVTRDSAEREAERIAKDKTSKPVYVLEAVSVFQRAETPVIIKYLQ